jgi:hypothetical protein
MTRDEIEQAVKEAYMELKRIRASGSSQKAVLMARSKLRAAYAKRRRAQMN